MSTVIVRYTVKPDKSDDNVRAIEAVFAALNAAAPGGLRYASFKSSDGLSFTHIASIETADGNNPLTELDAFKAFQKGLKEDRMDQPPSPMPVELVGAYGFFAD